MGRKVECVSCRILSPLGFLSGSRALRIKPGSRDGQRANTRGSRASSKGSSARQSRPPTHRLLCQLSFTQHICNEIALVILVLLDSSSASPKLPRAKFIKIIEQPVYTLYDTALCTSSARKKRNGGRPHRGEWKWAVGAAVSAPVFASPHPPAPPIHRHRLHPPRPALCSTVDSVEGGRTLGEGVGLTASGDLITLQCADV